MTFGVLLGVVAIGSWYLTGRLRRFALSREIVDVPNYRSSHTVPTPRGGGLAIVVTTSLGILVWGWMVPADQMPPALLGAGLIVAAIGLVDDRRDVPAGLRLVCHFAAAVLAVWGMGGAPPITLGPVVVAPWPIGNVLVVVLVVWWLNLTNFMDGIDGIAGGQTIVVCVGAAAVMSSVGVGAPTAGPALLLAAGTAGFLVWNWPPARIFLGDVGSGYVGFFVAVLAVWSAHSAPRLLWVWLVLSAVFLVDATVTLLLRLGRGERVTEAHRSHAYQYLARHGHLAVTVGCVVIGVVWLLPIACAIAVEWVPAQAAAGVAVAPLVATVLILERKRRRANLSPDQNPRTKTDGD